MSEVVWPKSSTPRRYEAQWLGGLSGRWWRISYHRFKWAAVLAAAFNMNGTGRVIDHKEDE